jgi:DNA mismatch endonuclease (patch repair protein)
MADVLTKKQRSYNMAQIKSKNTGPELALRKLLSENKVRGYRLHSKIFGKPDLVFTKKRLAVFIDGCFWHKCPGCFVKPTSRTKFWKEKIRNNIKRDKEVNKFLEKNNWKFLRIWEHELKKNPEKACLRIIRQLK